MIVLESNQNHAQAKDTEICYTLPASMGMGGGYVPMIVEPIAFVNDITIKKQRLQRPTVRGRRCRFVQPNDDRQQEQDLEFDTE